MNIRFEKDYLKELYENGKEKKKKPRFQKNIISRYIKVINYLKATEKVEDLYQIRSLNYEKLKGDKNGIESVRVNDQYRIEFVSSVEGESPDFITIISVIELSNHYK